MVGRKRDCELTLLLESAKLQNREILHGEELWEKKHQEGKETDERQAHCGSGPGPDRRVHGHGFTGVEEYEVVGVVRSASTYQKAVARKAADRVT